MGKRLIQQRRGRVNGRYNAPSHRYRGEIKYAYDLKDNEGIVDNILHDPGRTAPLVSIRLKDNKIIYTIAPEGIKIGDKIRYTEEKGNIAVGNVLSLGKTPEGTPIYNIELAPGDGGKLVRAGGTTATVVTQHKGRTVVRLPSGRFKTLDSNCRATVGIAAGGGRKDKPFVKAGKKYHAYRTRGKLYPTVRGVAMNAVSHPHGGGAHQHVGKPSSIKRGASPGRKVGSIAAKRTGRK